MVKKMIDFICMICNQWSSEAKTDDINFLYNDYFYRGLPVCQDCIYDFFGVHLNYESPKISTIKPTGLMKWL